MQTPPHAIWPLLDYLPKHWTIWESACGSGYLVEELQKHGYKVKWSDIERDTKEDFFTYSPRAGFDCQVTNPPFNIKNDWLRRSYELGKPFALLLPLEALAQKDRQAMYRKYGLEIIIPNNRYLFETPNVSSSAWFDTAWFCWQLGIGRQITFYEYSKDGWKQANENWKSYLASTGKLQRKRKDSSRS